MSPPHNCNLHRHTLRTVFCVENWSSLHRTQTIADYVNLSEQEKERSIKLRGMALHKEDSKGPDQLTGPVAPKTAEGPIVGAHGQEALM
mmetsp:Transcript_5916/g.13470  ORF Transcript_5916/g.13470 Transcript_5916/m.13470 type:complete len:89 (+) Transcript_5916:703-969(+)